MYDIFFETKTSRTLRQNYTTLMLILCNNATVQYNSFDGQAGNRQLVVETGFDES